MKVIQPTNSWLRFFVFRTNRKSPLCLQLWYSNWQKRWVLWLAQITVGWENGVEKNKVRNGDQRAIFSEWMKQQYYLLECKMGLSISGQILKVSFRKKWKKRTMHSLTRNIQQFCIINQLFETKKTFIILSYYNSDHNSANETDIFVFYRRAGPDLLGMVPTVDNIPVLLLKSIVIQNLLLIWITIPCF